MENETDPPTKPETAPKRPRTSSESQETPANKKVRLEFSAKTFRKQLKTDQKTEALQGFLHLITENNHNCVAAYLEHGGSALELLQLMESDSALSPVLVFDIVNKVLLRINAKLSRFQNGAFEACRYFLNNYVTLINKMLGLSSSGKERLVTLKLLTSIVTFSAVLAKDVLLHVNFNPTNLELLTKAGDVRGAFVHFIAAFLVDGHFPTLSVLLEKKGLMTSIVSGLQYDKVETVVLILTAMKTHILENPAVSKTAKMKTFSTPVVKSIVNLYNWKGPAGLVDPKKKNKVVTVDELDKSKVSEAVHAFLLVLCTSHKFGIVFKDYNIGLDKKNQNNLMYTVLDSLERPWEHSYAGELVTKICKACPDLTKTMWAQVKPFLEPRWTVKWLNAMKFAHRLLDELQPDCLDFCINNLSAHQLSQIITGLIAPLSILKAVYPENGAFDQPAVKNHVLSLVLKMARKLEIYVKKAPTWPINHEILSAALANHVQRNFPSIDSILAEWDHPDEESPIRDRLDTALDLLQTYKVVSPKIFDESSLTLDVNEFLAKTEAAVDSTDSRRLQVKAASVFMDFEPVLFRPTGDLFGTVLGLAMEFYFESHDPNVSLVLGRLLGNSGVFDGYSAEIDFWADGVLNLKNYDASVADFLCFLVRHVDENAAEYNKKLFEMKNCNFGPLLLSLGDVCAEREPSKAVKNYLSFVVLNLCHLQVDLSAFSGEISKYDFLSDDLRCYVQNWAVSRGGPLGKCKGKLMERFRKFSAEFLEGTIETFDFEHYSNGKLNFLQAVVFYLVNLANGGALKRSHADNARQVVDHLISCNAFSDDRYVRAILANPSVLHNFTLFDSDHFVTKFVLEIVTKLDVDHYLGDFRRKIVAVLSKVFRKPQKQENSTVSHEILEIVGLDYEQCYKLVEKFVSFQENRKFYRVACYCLTRMAELAATDYGLKPLSNDVIAELTRLLVGLISDQTPNLSHFTNAVLSYLKVFPHNIDGVEIELFDSLIALPEFHKDNLALCEFLLERKAEFMVSFENNLSEICSKKGFLLALLDAALKRTTPELERQIFENFETHIVKALQKPHKAGQHFQSRHRSIAVLVEKFMNVEKLGAQVQKFETAELFHVYLLKTAYTKADKTEKTLGNMIMTFVHLLVGLLKQKNGPKTNGLREIGGIVFDFLKTERDGFDLSFLGANESLKTLCKLCLKHGVGGDPILLKILAEFVEFCIAEDDAKLLLEMLLSHSLFLDVVLGDSPKDEIMNMWLVLCSKWPQFMERSHMPVLLSSYRATRADATILRLLRLYESAPDQTKFFDFKPFLWGRAAASHYSVRSDLQKVLWRQPKMGDVLNTLHHQTILATIKDPSGPHSYDLDYFLPLFSHILAPENPVTTYRFTKSGALALALVGFRGDKPQRQATCNVLQRFYFHLEAKQSGKDTVLWLRLIEAIAKGVAVIDDFKVNNFVGIFLSRTALVLAQPTDVMYVPLSQYLAAKDSLDFRTIPELYTFLHSAHVDSKEHRRFVLEVIRDGLRTEKDFTTFMKSMGFKLISELCSSTVCDAGTKVLVLEIFRECCRVPLGVKVLCGNLSFLTQVFGILVANLREGPVVLKLLEIMLAVVEADSDRHRNFVVYLNMMILWEEGNFRWLVESRGLDVYYRVLMVVVDRFPEFFSREHMDHLLDKSGDQFCRYLTLFGCRYVEKSDICDHVGPNCLRLLFYQKLKLNK